MFLLAALTLTIPARAEPPPAEWVFFDVPGELMDASPPAPTVQLAAVPGYPDDTNRLTLAGLLYLPDPEIHGGGPYPAVMVLHGSGGLWSSDIITNGLASQFDDWATVLPAQGYAGLFVDSFNPRGIAENYANRRPHHDPTLNDAACSPNYERPKDVVAALAFLNDRPEIDPARIGLLGFSHGSQAGLNAILDPSIDLTPYTVRYINVSNQTVDLEVPSPVRIPESLPFPPVCVFYYPGCSHYGYHGQASSIAADRYMPDRRTRVLMFHGTLDSLLGVSDPLASPLTGTLYPIKFVESARTHADALGIPSPFAHHLVYDRVNHSFDGEELADPIDWNTPNETADQKAKRLSRDETLKWFALYLQPASLQAPESSVPDQATPVIWRGATGLVYAVEHAAGPGAPWTIMDQGWQGNGSLIEIFPGGGGPQTWYRVIAGALPPPFADPDHAGFFLDYTAFSY